MLGLLLFPPLLGFVINALRFKQEEQKKLSGWIGSGACFVSFLAALFCFATFQGGSTSFSLGSWVSVGDLEIPFTFVLDSLSLLMSLLITGVGTLIHLYSIGYMSKDEGITRYFAYLNLFVFMMLILVLGNSLPLLFVGWEGVGLCSYLLIGFWFKDKEKVEAGMKAFVVNRIGDAFFLLGMFLLFFHFETLQFEELNNLFLGKTFSGFLNPATLGAFLLFLGATGKSAQLPLYVWLADAMAGPTPVSALIHAATMVTAGIYMIVRLFGLYASSPDLLLLIGWVGALTSLGAALVATRQWDLKKVLAYSTISQLAYMFMAIGVGAFTASVFHLLTHGFFKALLFLCAGSVIHGLSGEQDIRFMGGLRKHLPKTFLTYMVGALALMALPPFSGFFSKDEILMALFSKGQYGLWALGVLTAFCTVFYMTRLTILVFFGEKRFKSEPHESPMIMWIPLAVLAFVSLFGHSLLSFPVVPYVVLSLSGFLLKPFGVEVASFLKPLKEPFKVMEDFHHKYDLSSFHLSHSLEVALIVFVVFVSLVIILASSFYYLKSRCLEKKALFLKKILENSFYTERGLRKWIYPSFVKTAQSFSRDLEQSFLQGTVLALSRQVLVLRKQLALWQNSYLQSYALYFVIGLSVFVLLVFLK